MKVFFPLIFHQILCFGIYRIQHRRCEFYFLNFSICGWQCELQANIKFSDIDRNPLCHKNSQIAVCYLTCICAEEFLLSNGRQSRGKEDTNRISSKEADDSSWRIKKPLNFPSEATTYSFSFDNTFILVLRLFLLLLFCPHLSFPL